MLNRASAGRQVADRREDDPAAEKADAKIARTGGMPVPMAEICPGLRRKDERRDALPGGTGIALPRSELRSGKGALRPSASTRRIRASSSEAIRGLSANAPAI